jgi:energy-coupling factor transporter transmembrane protein EcfT
MAGPGFALLLAASSFCLLLLSGLGPLRLLRDSGLVALFALFSAGLRFLGLPESMTAAREILALSAAYGARLLAAFLAGRLFYATTSPSELRDAATRITRRLPILGRWDLGLALSLILGFIPLIFDEWKASLEAARSRGMPQRPGLGRQALFVAAFLRRLMLRAVAVPEALSARGWTRSRGLSPLRWSWRDSLASIACAGLTLAAALRLV